MVEFFLRLNERVHVGARMQIEGFQYFLVIRVKGIGPILWKLVHGGKSPCTNAIDQS